MSNLRGALTRSERIARWRSRADDLRTRAFNLRNVSTAARDTYLQLAENCEAMASQLADLDRMHTGALAEHLAACERASRKAGC